MLVRMVAVTLAVGGLMLAAWGGWRMPFLVVAGLGLVICVFAVALLPPMTSHLDRVRGAALSDLGKLFTRSDIPLSYLAVLDVQEVVSKVAPQIARRSADT